MPTHRIDAGISQEHFYAFLEEELKKIEKFTKHQVSFFGMQTYQYNGKYNCVCG